MIYVVVRSAIWPPHSLSDFLGLVVRIRHVKLKVAWMLATACTFVGLYGGPPGK